MRIITEFNGQSWAADLDQPTEIALAAGSVRCFYASPYTAQPYRSDDFVGSVEAGAPVNFYDISLSPHGNGTHTECLGHITAAHQSVNEQLRRFHFVARLVSVPLVERENGDRVVDLPLLEKACPLPLPPALILRTLPNSLAKRSADYSGTNPPYLTTEVAEWLVEHGVEHLLLDLPSVDRESDGGALAAHHIFWGLDSGLTSEVASPTPTDAKRSTNRGHCTITELIFVPDALPDGLYLLNLMVPDIPLDAVPSRPVLYPLEVIVGG